MLQDLYLAEQYKCSLKNRISLEYKRTEESEEEVSKGVRFVGCFCVFCVIKMKNFEKREFYYFFGTLYCVGKNYSEEN